MALELPLPQLTSRPITLVVAAIAGALFALLLIWIFGALGWMEAGLAQALLSGNRSGIHFFYRFVVPLVDAAICGLLVGSTLGLMRIHNRWLHILIFFAAFYAFQLVVSGARLFAHLFVIAPFMWLFPLMACIFLLASVAVQRRG